MLIQISLVMTVALGACSQGSSSPAETDPSAATELVEPAADLELAANLDPAPTANLEPAPMANPDLEPAPTTEPGASADVAPAPALAPTDPDEPAEAAVRRCEETSAPDPCVVAALDGRIALRARERERVIAAHEALGNQARLLHHMALFVHDYPRDRRSNRMRLRLTAAAREPDATPLTACWASRDAAGCVERLLGLAPTN